GPTGLSPMALRVARGLFRLWLVLSVLWIGGVQGRDVEYGTYACVTQNLVGQQTSTADNIRHSGPIKPPTDSFLVTIEKIERGFVCDPARPSFWGAPHTYDWWWKCDAKNQATMSEGKATGLRFRSDDMHIFLGDLGGFFWLTIDGRYWMAFHNLVGDHYLEEGVCGRTK